jgi:hypothetical protein
MVKMHDIFESIVLFAISKTLLAISLPLPIISPLIISLLCIRNMAWLI